MISFDVNEIRNVHESNLPRQTLPNSVYFQPRHATPTMLTIMSTSVQGALARAICSIHAHSKRRLNPKDASAMNNGPLMT